MHLNEAIPNGIKLLGVKFCANITGRKHNVSFYEINKNTMVIPIFRGRGKFLGEKNLSPF